MHDVLLPLRIRCNVDDCLQYSLGFLDCFACVIVERDGFVGLCGSSGSLGFSRKVSVATEERAERRDGGGAVEEFVMLVRCTGYGARTIRLKLDPRQTSSNESKPVRSSHSRLTYQPKRPSTALEEALGDVTGRTENRRHTMIPVLSYLEGLSPGVHAV